MRRAPEAHPFVVATTNLALDSVSLFYDEVSEVHEKWKVQKVGNGGKRYKWPSGCTHPDLEAQHAEREIWTQRSTIQNRESRSLARQN